MPLELGFKKLEDPGVEMLKFAGKRYRFLLFALIGIILLAPMAGAGPTFRVVFDLLATAIFMIALWAVLASSSSPPSAMGISHPPAIWPGVLR